MNERENKYAFLLIYCELILNCQKPLQIIIWCCKSANASGEISIITNRPLSIRRITDIYIYDTYKFTSLDGTASNSYMSNKIWTGDPQIDTYSRLLLKEASHSSLTTTSFNVYDSCYGFLNSLPM